MLQAGKHYISTIECIIILYHLEDRTLRALPLSPRCNSALSDRSMGYGHGTTTGSRFRGGDGLLASECRLLVKASLFNSNTQEPIDTGQDDRNKYECYSINCTWAYICKLGLTFLALPLWLSGLLPYKSSLT